MGDNHVRRGRCNCSSLDRNSTRCSRRERVRRNWLPRWDRLDSLSYHRNCRSRLGFLTSIFHFNVFFASSADSLRLNSRSNKTTCSHKSCAIFSCMQLSDGKIGRQHWIKGRSQHSIHVRKLEFRINSIQCLFLHILDCVAHKLNSSRWNSESAIVHCSLQLFVVVRIKPGENLFGHHSGIVCFPFTLFFWLRNNWLGFLLLCCRLFLLCLVESRRKR